MPFPALPTSRATRQAHRLRHPTSAPSLRAGRHAENPPQRRRALVIVIGVAAALGLGFALPSVAAPSTWVSVAHDTYSRTASGGWGAADAGGAWSHGGASSAFAVSSGAGTARVSPGSAVAATLASVSQVQVQAQTTFSSSAAAAGITHSLVVRRQSDGSSYRTRLVSNPSGNAVLSVGRQNGSTYTTLSTETLPFTFTTGQSMVVDLQVTGTSPVYLKARAWLAGSSEASWKVTATDSSASRITSPGSVGLWSHLVSTAPAAITLTTRTFDAWTAPTSTSPPTSSSSSSSPTPSSSSSSSSPKPSSSSSSSTSPTPTSSTSTTAAPALPARGTTVGSATYAVPSGALYVSTTGSDSNAGTSASAPLRTLTRALGKAASGQTIVLRGGTYNEAVRIDKSGITIQNYPGEAVWLDGSVPVTTWSASGSAWVSSGWTASFDRSTSSVRGDTGTSWITSANPYASWPDMVFYDGAQLRQVGSAAAVVAGTFYVDYGADRLYIGNNPSGHAVRASNKGMAIYSSGTGTTLRGFGVRRFATPIPDLGTVRLDNRDGTLRDLAVVDNATIGIKAGNYNHVLDNVDSSRNGLAGFIGNQAYNLKISDSVIASNNLQKFATFPVSGGIKITRSRGVTVTNSDVSSNLSAGIWCDESCYDVRYTNNTVNGNTTTGMQLELSEKGIIANNEVLRNQNGIQLMNTGGVQIWNNEIGGSGVFGIKLKMDKRRNATTSLPGHDPWRPLPDSTVPWIVKNITISNNVMGSGGLYQFHSLDWQSNVSTDTMHVVINGNLLNTYTASGQTHMVGWGLGDNKTVVNYENPAALAKAKNTSWNNAATSQQSTETMLSARTAYASIALPLPSDVAAAIGRPAGSTALGNY